MSDEKDIPKLNDKQRRFCLEYCIDLDRNRAYKVAYPSDKSDATVRANASRMLTNANILEYIAELQENTAEALGITRIGVAKELQKIAFANMGDYNDDWHELKEWDKLTDDQKAAISEITHTKTTFEGGEKVMIKFKTHDKLKGIADLNKMLGFNEPEEFKGSIEGIKRIEWVD